jgi:hypothetical protein
VVAVGSISTPDVCEARSTMGVDTYYQQVRPRRLGLLVTGVDVAVSKGRMTAAEIRALAKDLDFAIDVTEPREVMLARFEDILRKTLACSDYEARTLIHPCRCGHEKGDHQQRLGQHSNYTPCCITGCNCDGFRKERRVASSRPAAQPEQEQE